MKITEIHTKYCYWYYRLNAGIALSVLLAISFGLSVLMPYIAAASIMKSCRG